METLTYRRKKVYDPVLRLIHLWNGLSILFLMMMIWLSELFEKGVGEDTFWTLHIYVGYGLAVGVVARLTWGLIGPQHARLSDMWHPHAWWSAVRNRSFKTEPRFGHHALASAAYFTVYVMLVTMALTGLGLAAIEHSAGPFSGWLGDMPWIEDALEEPHELIYNLLMAFVVVHIAALILHERQDKTPLAQSMVTGYQYELEQAGEVFKSNEE